MDAGWLISKNHDFMFIFLWQRSSRFHIFPPVFILFFIRSFCVHSSVHAGLHLAFFDECLCVFSVGEIQSMHVCAVVIVYF